MDPVELEKTYAYKVLLVEVRSRGLLTIPTALSNVAVNIMSRVRRTHLQFKISLNIDNKFFGIIKKKNIGELLNLFGTQKIITWDRNINF